MAARVLADLGDSVMGRAHERADPIVEGLVENADDGCRVLEPEGLGPRLFLRHVVDAEELVVAQQQPVECGPLLGRCGNVTGGHPAFLLSHLNRTRPARPGGSRTDVSPFIESVRIISSTESVMAALSKVLTPSCSPSRTRATNVS